MKIYIASDHAGFTLKNRIIAHFSKINLVDLGCDSKDNVDYPDYAHKLCLKIKNNSDRGILICGSGVGMSIAANRHKNIRAALCFDAQLAELARRHNDANILVLGARFIEEVVAFECVNSFITTEFEQGRHLIRVGKI